MVAQLRSAERELACSCKVLFDLPGPKLRTLPIAPGARILHLRPRHDEAGQTVEVARVFLRAVEGDPPGEPNRDEIWVPASWARELAAGDQVELTDLRGKRRTLHVTRCTPDGAECESARGIYLGEESTLCAPRASGGARKIRPVRIRARVESLRLVEGDLLLLKGDASLGQPARAASAATPATPAAISCELPEALAELRVGQPVLFDDGKIGAEVEQLRDDGALLRIRHTRAGGARLKAGRGINLPETDLSRLPSLSAADLAAIDVAAEHADLIGLSFTRGARDVAVLHDLLAQRGLAQLGLILKIETRAGFEALPQILFEALKRPNVGIMIARGDLAVECGFERLAELQEEMLWLCEAARIPAIWATQVLEGLAKKGQASRAEITDAAMAERAECVMLNKGPYVREAMRSLRDVLARMRGHQEKKRSMLRPLRSVHLEAFDTTSS
jgi:pyruvate kinase